MTHKRAPFRRLIATLATVALSTAGLWGVAAPAGADEPPEPVAEFSAQECEGTTFLDPTNAEGVVGDLTRVFGQRLAEYNAGHAVILYDAFGDNNNNAYPPVCAVRHVDGVGAVSEWMFCTDYYSHVCSGVDADGNLLDGDGNPIPGLDTLEGRNEKLTADQEKVIAYLVQHGSETYDGVGYFSFSDADRAVSNGDSWERAALQVLVWCISDPVTNATNPTEVERQQTCEANMGPERQAEILAGIPDDPSLDVTGPVAALQPGETAEFSITTNVSEPALTVAVDGVAGTLAVVSGPGVLADGRLQVTTDGDPVTVVLGYTADDEGAVDLEVTAAPTATAHIGWNQSPGVSDDGRPCQVFATFHVDDQVILSGAAVATFAIDDEGADADVDGGAHGAGADAGSDGEAEAGGADSGGEDAGANANGADGAGAVGSAATAASTSAGGESGGGASGGTSTELASTGADSVSPIVLLAALAAVVGGAVIAFRRRSSITQKD